MAKKWEGSPADMKIDKKHAKKAGMSMKKWEGSPADEKIDKAAAKKSGMAMKKGGPVKCKAGGCMRMAKGGGAYCSMHSK